MNEFTKLIGAFLDFIAPFNRSITNIHVKSTDEEVLVVAPASDRSIEIRCSAKAIPELQGNACLGELSYLKQLVDTFATKKESIVEMEYLESQNQKKPALRSMRFKSGKRYDLFYQATDPFYGNVILPVRLTITEWPVVFGVTKEMCAAFKELRTVMMASTTSGDGIFQLCVTTDKEIIAVFGKGSSQSTMTFDTEVEVTGNYVGKINLISEVFAKVLDLGVAYPTVVYFNPKAVKFEMETPIGVLTILLSGRIVDGK